MAIGVIITFMLTVLATLIWATTQPSAAERSRTAPGSSEGARVPVRRVRPCTARKAVKFYSARVRYWTQKMGAAEPNSRAWTTSRCPRYLARVLRAKAYGLRTAYADWYEHEYAWWHWLPDKFRRVGHCETGGTPGATAAGNWSWDSGRYVSAFGIIRAAFPGWNGHNTPREQYEVAAAIQARYGWGAWGCGGA